MLLVGVRVLLVGFRVLFVCVRVLVVGVRVLLVCIWAHFHAFGRMWDGQTGTGERDRGTGE